MPHVLAVLLELGFRQDLVAADRHAGYQAFLAAREAVLHGLHLHVLPVLAEAADDAAMARALAIRIVPSFPHADRREMRRLHGRGAPLVARVVRNAVHPNFAA